jgi:ppGpp synthetase/RelA/SpoT-type nucleotidyltranferase
VRTGVSTWELDEFERAYNEAAASFSALAPLAADLVGRLLTEEGIRVHSISRRVKDKESVQRKLASKADRYSNVKSLTDLLGLRIITYFPDEVDVVASVIEREFAIDRENSVDKRAILDPDRFGYLSLHYIASLDSQRASLTEYKRFAGLKFELQIRSILQHAWAEINHSLGYKSEAVLPKELRRRFFRLAGLLELADDQFLELKGGAAKARR